MFEEPLVNVYYLEQYNCYLINQYILPSSWKLHYFSKCSILYSIEKASKFLLGQFDLKEVYEETNNALVQFLVSCNFRTQSERSNIEPAFEMVLKFPLNFWIKAESTIRIISIEKKGCSSTVSWLSPIHEAISFQLTVASVDLSVRLIDEHFSWLFYCVKHIDFLLNAGVDSFNNKKKEKITGFSLKILKILNLFRVA